MGKAIDYIKESNTKVDVPHGFEFWQPNWSIEEKTIHGRVVRVVNKNQNERASEPLTYKCNDCDFKTGEEKSIRMHVLEHLKKDVKDERSGNVVKRKRGRPSSNKH